MIRQIINLHNYSYVYQHFLISTYNYFLYMSSSFERIIKNPVQITKELKALCLNQPLICEKQSERGLTSHQRVVCATETQFQYYNLPLQFKQKNLSTLKQNDLKASVKFQDILEMQYLPRKNDKKKIILLTIPFIKIFHKQQSKISSTPIINWKFTFKFDVPSYIKLKRDQEDRQKQNNQKLVFQSIAHIFTESNASSKIQPKEEKPIETHIEELRRVKNFIKLKQKLQKQEMMIKELHRKKMAQNKFINQEYQSDEQVDYPIAHFWQDYIMAYNQVIKTTKKPNITVNSIINAEFNLFKAISYFKEQSINIFKEYVDKKTVGWKSQKLTLNNFKYFKGVWIKIGDKQLNQQFMAYNCIADVISQQKSAQKLSLRVPLMCLCSYKCYKGLIMMDFSLYHRIEKNIVYQLVPEQNYNTPEQKKIINALQNISMVLGLKQEPMIKQNLVFKVPLGKKVIVLQYLYRKNRNDSQIKQIDHNFLYLYGVDNIFPFDFNFLTKNPKSWLRPQFIADFREKLQAVSTQNTQLLSEAFKISSSKLQYQVVEDQKVAKASFYLMNIKLQQLSKKLSSLEILYIDSQSITSGFHQFGINIRYLYKVKQMVNLPYLQEMIQIQAIARVCKNIYRNSLNDLIKNSKQFNTHDNSQQKKLSMLKILQNQHQSLIHHAIDFLNLIFSNDHQSQSFWEIIIQKCSISFNIKPQYPIKLKPGCLLHSIIWHCGFIIKFNQQIELFKKRNPFKLQNWVDFQLKIKSYNFQSFQTHRILQKIPYITKLQKEKINEQLGFDILKLELMVKAYSSSDIEMSLSKMNNYKQYIRKPQREVPLHPIEISYYIINKSEYNFHKALQICNFSLPDTHPIYISLYYQYSFFHQSQLMKKACLLAAVQSLGQYHPKTTQIYSKFYKQGNKQFQIKALRQKNIEQIQQNCLKIYNSRKYESCMQYCRQQILNRNLKQINSIAELESFIKILKYGLHSANQTFNYKVGLVFSSTFSEVINLYNVKETIHHDTLIKETLLIKMSCSQQKFYLYKMVLLALHIQSDHEGQYPKNEQGMRLPCSNNERQTIIKGIIQDYYVHESHANWIDDIFKKLISGLMYFNYLQDLFTKYQYHLDNYNEDYFKKALSYLHLLIKLYGQSIFDQYLYQIGQLVEAQNNALKYQ